MLKSKEQLVKEIQKNLPHFTSKKAMTNIQEEMLKYGVSEGAISRFLIHPEKLLDVDLRELALLTEQFFKNSEEKAIALNPENWFTKPEMQEAKRYYKTTIDSGLGNFPITLENVSILGEGVYSTAIDVKLIAKWINSGDLYYNFDIQRNPDTTIRNKEVIRTPKIHKKNVEEIKNLLLKKELVITTLAFNVDPLETEEEIYYDHRNHTLTISKGTRLDILDGFHRCLGSAGAVSENPELEFSFNVLISNYSTREAQQYQAQLAKAVPIPKARVKQLEGNRYADTVTKMLIRDSDLKDRVSTAYRVVKSSGQWVSYSTLSDAIEREFKMNTKIEAIEVGNYLIKFFDYLIGYNMKQIESPDSVMGKDKIFAGYVALAASMYEKGAKASSVVSAIKKIDFSYENPLWQKIGYLNENGNVVKSSKAVDKQIANYFREIC